jgi:hypothetical protein
VDIQTLKKHQQGAVPGPLDHVRCAEVKTSYNSSSPLQGADCELLRTHHLVHISAAKLSGSHREPQATRHFTRFNLLSDALRVGKIPT